MEDKRVQLFLLPFAGGTSASFNQLAGLLDRRIEAVSVEYAGRLGRRGEPYITEYGSFLQDVADYIAARRNGLPFAVLGYSLGSALAFDLIAGGMVACGDIRHCFACARGNLKNRSISQEYHGLSDGEFARKMAELGGFDGRILENRRFRDIYMRPARMDYMVWSQYRYRTDGRKMACDTTVIYSPQDPLSADAGAWRDFTDGNVSFYELGDGHFFIRRHYREMAGIINRCLTGEGGCV